MEYISIIMNEDAAHDCLAELGKLEAIQFSDVSRYQLQTAMYKRKFVANAMFAFAYIICS